MTYRRLRAYLYLLIVSVIWGAASVIIKLTLSGIHPFPFLTYRFAIAGIFGVLYFIFFKPKLPKSPVTFAATIIYGLLSTTFALTFLFLGLEKTGVLTLSLISLTGPLLVAIGGVIFLKEHITHREKIGTLVAFLGTLLTIIEPLTGGSHSPGELIGNIFIMLYILTDVASLVVLKKTLREKVDPMVLTNIGFIVAFITLLPITLIMYTPTALISSITDLSLGHHMGVWYMALISGTAAYAIRAKAQKTIELGEAGLFGYLTAIFTAPLAVIMLGESITTLFIIGALIIVIGIIIAEYKS